MTRAIVLFLLSAVMVLSTASGQDGGFGLGIIIGEPTGVSGKLWLKHQTAIDGAVAWSWGKKSALYLHADYLFHRFDLLNVEKGKLPLYYGVGGNISFVDDGTLGVRIPVGVDYLFAKEPLDVFFEIVPLLHLAPSTEFDLHGGIGVRFFFR